MRPLPFILLLIGLVLIFIEFFVPGGILGAIAAVLLIASIVVFAMESHSVVWTLVYIAGIIIVIGALIKYTLWRIKKGKVKGIFLNTEQSGYVASEFAKELIGKQGEAITDLKPAGHIIVAGKRYQAVSKMGYLDKGVRIEVVGGEGAHLIVKKVEEKNGSFVS